MQYINPQGEYPKYYGDIQLANPEWNLGDPLPEGWLEVEDSPVPELGEYETAECTGYEDVDGTIRQVWTVREMTAKEKAVKDAPKTTRAKLEALGFTEEEIMAVFSGRMF